MEAQRNASETVYEPDRQMTASAVPTAPAEQETQNTEPTGRVTFMKNSNRRHFAWRAWNRVALPIIPPLMALGGVFVGARIEDDPKEGSSSRSRLEKAFDTNRELYASLMSSLQKATFVDADKGKTFQDTFLAVDTAFFKIEPYLENSVRQSVWIELRQFEADCEKLAASEGEAAKQNRDAARKRRDLIAKSLRRALFPAEAGD